MNNTELIYKTLNKYWGYNSFRTPQEEIIKNILDNKDCFVTLATGGGKSLIFQLPALIKDGITIVISPLIALMEDQVNGLNKKGINAIYLNSTLLPSQEKKAYKDIQNGVYKLIYLSPEKLMSEKLKSLLNKTNISMIVFDEVHCLSEWGHDFRPDYKRVAENIKVIFNDVQIVALTATITPKAKKDIIQTLNLKEPFISTSSFNRKNIYLGVKKFWTIFGKYKFLKSQIERSNKILVYCSSRKETEIMTEKISHSLKTNASFYHAGCSNDFRKNTQNKFKTGEIKCLFATTAFGMGIDISDIDTVIYWNCASSIEEYYQGIGRAGRNENINAKSWIIYTPKDIGLQKNIIEFEIPDKNLIKKIITGLSQKESTNKIRSNLKIPETLINSISLLYENHYDNFKESEVIDFILLNLKVIKNNKTNKFSEFKTYLKSRNCKRKFLLNYFGESLENNCNSCSYCNRE